MTGYANPELLTTPPPLPRRSSSRRARRWSSTSVRPEDFATGHIPGAVHLDLWGVSLIDTDPGAAEGVHVDDRSPVQPARRQRGHAGRRLRRAVGHPRRARASGSSSTSAIPRVQVLDGGFNAWIARAACRSRARPAPPPKSTWTGTPQDHTIATWRDVHERLGRPDVVLLDTRSDGEYDGTTGTREARRAHSRRGARRMDAQPRPGRRLQARRRAARDVRAGRRHARQGSRHLLPGRLPRRARLPRAAPARLSAGPQLHRLVEGMGRPGRICRSRRNLRPVDRSHPWTSDQ